MNQIVFLDIVTDRTVKMCFQIKFTIGFELLSGDLLLVDTLLLTTDPGPVRRKYCLISL